MNKLKRIIHFIQNSNNKNDIILWLIKSIMSLPGIIIHEGLHILFIMITFCKFEKGKWIFFDVVKNENKEDIIRYCFPISLNKEKSNIKKLLVSTAPCLSSLIWIILSVYLISFTNIIQIKLLIWSIMMIYMIIIFESLWLSDDDIDTAITSFNNIKRKLYLNHFG